MSALTRHEIDTVASFIRASDLNLLTVRGFPLWTEQLATATAKSRHVREMMHTYATWCVDHAAGLAGYADESMPIGRIRGPVGRLLGGEHELDIVLYVEREPAERAIRVLREMAAGLELDELLDEMEAA